MSIFAADKTKLMMRLEHIYGVIAKEGFTDRYKKLMTT